MAKRPTNPAVEKKPPAAAKKEPKPAASLDGKNPAFLAYEDPKHITRILAARGGPWTEQVVATSVADKEISKMLAGGYDLLHADHITIVPDGIFFLWLLAKPVGHPGQRLKEIRHITRPIASGMGAQPPAMTVFQADGYLDSLFREGWRLFRPKPVAVDPGGLTMLWILVR